MVSQRVMDDLAALEARGIRLAPEEVVRLNCLGLRAERASDSADMLAAPRVAWAGPVAIHEPTLSSSRWVDTYASRWFAGDEYASALLWACAHAPVKGWFTRAEHLQEDSARAAIKAWGDSLTATEAQLKLALATALLGDDPGADVVPEKSARALRLAAKRGEEPVALADEAIIDEAISCGLGLSLEDLGALSFSRLVGILRRWRRRNGADAPESAAARAAADYTVTLAAIVRRHENAATGEA